MPDELVVDAGREIINASVLGAVLIFVVLALGWVVRQWLGSQAALLAEKEARRIDTKEHAASLGELKPALQANTGTLGDLKSLVQQLVDAERFRKER